ncbi:hypothetical protein AVEN_251024-1 [Araneus ventricosus]|uniref:Uncharacterized protein n=1 Tax=Araneus ventricosus TaxID=182803 RepID=A0A4Y2WJF3_ARAVE|nr:hypothetical protein AVEN_201496-1 [Araneus ventricosus]GBO36724.1 hypothetical protein AVEN_251024-1 [Araneus ventricosus]
MLKTLFLSSLELLFSTVNEGCSALVGTVLKLLSQLQGWNAPGLKPDFTEDPLCIGAWCALNPNHGLNILLLMWYSSLEGECQLVCSPYHLIMVRNFKVHSKIALVLLQNRA